MNDWNIGMIEELTEREASALSIETMQIKGHNVYFVDFGGYFGYSALVYMDGRHIHYANDYKLHHNHQNMTREELRSAYIEALNGKLFTEDEITGPVADYDDYSAKSYFLHNYYGMRRYHRSIFGIWTPENEAEFHRETEDMTYDSVAFAYFEDPAFVKHHCALYNALKTGWQARQGDYEVMKAAFIREMWNHEYAINWEGDWNVLSAFGNVVYHDGDCADELQDYFDQLKFTDTQRSAYLDARREYMKQANEVC